MLLGDGAGGFAAPANFPVGDGPFSVAVGDLDGDGTPDLAVANFNSGTVSVLLGDGTGGFAAPANFPVGDRPASVAVGDLDGDGFPDLATANASSDDVSVLLNVEPTPNQAPTAVDDTYSTGQDTALTVPAPGVLGNDTDPETDPLTAEVATDPANGTLTLNEDGSFDYTPAPGFSGTDSFTYTATDGTATSDPATVTITVTEAPNTRPPSQSPRVAPARPTAPPPR